MGGPTVRTSLAGGWPARIIRVSSLRRRVISGLDSWRKAGWDRGSRNHRRVGPPAPFAPRSVIDGDVAPAKAGQGQSEERGANSGAATGGDGSGEVDSG